MAWRVALSVTGFRLFSSTRNAKAGVFVPAKTATMQKLVFSPQCSPWRTAEWDVQAPDDTISSDREAGHTNLLWLQGREMWLGKTKKEEQHHRAVHTGTWGRMKPCPLDRSMNVRDGSCILLTHFGVPSCFFLPTILHLEKKTKQLLSFSAMQITLHLDEKHY